jgi:hypothetical protein
VREQAKHAARKRKTKQVQHWERNDQEENEERYDPLGGLCMAGGSSPYKWASQSLRDIAIDHDLVSLLEEEMERISSSRMKGGVGIRIFMRGA